MRKWIRRVAKSFKRWRQRQIVRRHFGVDYPDSVQLSNSPHRLFLDPHDPRAYKVLLAAPLRGKIPRNQPFWQRGCMELRPQLALDIGLNFGECLFLPSYAPETEIHAFDANPRLLPYIEKSRAIHPDGERMQIHFGLVDAEVGPDATFYIDREWSGGSTAVSGLHPEDDGRFEVIQVPRTTIDTVLGSQSPGYQGLFFKIDVEGYEYRALQGMTRLLESCTWSVGLLEYDPQLLRKAGDDLGEYWSFLSSRFQIYSFGAGRKAKLVSGDWSIARREMESSELHTDLIVVGGQIPPEVERFLASWQEEILQRAA